MKKTGNEPLQIASRRIDGVARALMGAVALIMGCAGGEATGADDPVDTPAPAAIEHAQLRTSEGILDASFRRLGNGFVVIDGDILVDERELEAARVDRRGRSAVTTIGGARWPSAVVFYEIDPALPVPDRVVQAIAHWEANTPYRFFPRQGQSQYVRFVPSTPDDCSSPVGRQPSGQNVNLGDNCSLGATIHEIGHTIGLYHEQMRHDRDQYVLIHKECIDANYLPQFDKYVTGADVGPYDYSSIMHYGRNAFSNGCETITPLDPQAPPIGQRAGLSAGDILGAWRLYVGFRPGVHAVPADYDGDGKTDFAIKDDGGVWRVDLAANGFGSWDLNRPAYGAADSIPVPADYDGDGKADLAVKGCDGVWRIDYAASPQDGFNVVVSGYGDCSGQPVPADYDGDGKADLAVKGCDGMWRIDYAANGFGHWDQIVSGYGDCSGQAVPADYDGDGKADLAIKGCDGNWYVDYASDGFGAWNAIRPGYGDCSGTPVPADYDGDGKADFAIKGTDGIWRIDYAASPQDGFNVVVAGYGDRNSIPVPGNYDGVDGDGRNRADLAVKAVGGDGAWFVDRAATGFGAWDFYKPLGI